MIKRIYTILVLLSTLSFPTTRAQQTIGLFLNSPASFNGYTLFSSLNYPDAYLIDNCGLLVNKWTCEHPLTNASYLTQDGLLLRPENIDNFLNIAGTGGLLRLYDWDGNIVWEDEYSTDTYVQHHDVKPLPNGNILLIAYESRSYEECLAAGRDSSKLTAGGLWPEKLVELMPVGNDSSVVVWEWKVWDHLVQDFNPQKSNYGVVSEHPELVNINFIGVTGDVNPEDWLHFNSVDYNENLDQIMVSMRHFSEIWIIDHSTSTEEAAGHTGGNSGKGGDLLFRWGNPQTYNRGDENDQVLWGQHDAQWIPEDHPGGGKILLYNNGVWGPGHSTVDVIQPPLESDNSYLLAPGQAFGPESPDWSYGDPDSNFFYSPLISGAERMPNGNTLICVGLSGHFFEVDTNGNKVWDYISPVGPFGPLVQGNPIFFNAVFKIRRYSPDHPAFIGKDMTGTDPIEINPIPYECDLFYVGSVELTDAPKDTEVFPNPFSSSVSVRSPNLGGQVVRLFDMTGRMVLVRYADDDHLYLDLTHLVDGIYFLNTGNTVRKLIKNTQ